MIRGSTEWLMLSNQANTVQRIKDYGFESRPTLFQQFLIQTQESQESQESQGRLCPEENFESMWHFNIFVPGLRAPTHLSKEPVLLCV